MDLLSIWPSDVAAFRGGEQTQAHLVGLPGLRVTNVYRMINIHDSSDIRRPAKSYDVSGCSKLKANSVYVHVWLFEHKWHVTLATHRQHSRRRWPEIRRSWTIRRLCCSLSTNNSIRNTAWLKIKAQGKSFIQLGYRRFTEPFRQYFAHAASKLQVLIYLYIVHKPIIMYA